MHSLLLLLGLPGALFWRELPPERWSDRDVQEFLQESPWAHPAENASSFAPNGVQTFIGSASIVRAAERELERRTRPRPDPAKPVEPDEYSLYLKESKDKVIVLVVAMADWQKMSDAEEANMMEKETLLKIGRRKYRLEGHFPPTPNDSYLRLVFPRDIRDSDKTMVFELYVPGAPGPYRTVEYNLREMKRDGKLDL